MPKYTRFDTSVQCEERFGTDPDELAEVQRLMFLDNGPGMNCAICHGAIKPGDTVHEHHPIHRSAGGTETLPTHAACHVRFHSLSGDFKRWGKIGGQITAATKRWSLNLLNVRTDPAHEINRQFYYAYYGR